MNEEYIKDKYTFEDLVAVVHRLRQPDGCAWDSVQTYESMKKCVTDEAAEVVEAVDNMDYVNLKEELGDLLLQVIMYSDIARDRGEFTLCDVIDCVSKKMVRRHPHIFGDKETVDLEYKEVCDKGVSLWNAIKLREKQEHLQEYEKLYKQGKIKEELLNFHKDRYLNFLKKIEL